MSPSLRTLATALVLTMTTLITTPAALAHEDHDHGKAIEYRTALMDVFAWNLKPLMAMAKGKQPLDTARFARHVHDLRLATQLDLLSGFPEDSDEGEDTDARPDIWLDWTSFEEKYQTLVKAAAALEKTAGGADPVARKRAVLAVGKACKSCHKAFRD